jgi:transcriptional regulator with XRE-family HTH domain
VSVGKAVKRLRVAAGTTQVRLANLVGVEQPTISRWERGIDAPGFDDVQSIEKALKIQPGSIYVAAGLVRAEPVEAAILADSKIDATWIPVVLDAYRSAVRRSAEQRHHASDKVAGDDHRRH